MDNNKNSHRERNRVIGGLILVAVGGALLLRNMDFPLPHWLFTWPMILILVGVYTGFKHDFRNLSWLILIALGAFFLIDKNIYDLNIRQYFWPIFIIGLGLLFILRPKNKSWGNNQYKTTNEPYTTSYQQENIVVDDSDFLNISSVFSGIKRIILSKNFQGGKISCVFGGVDIDLLQADINGKVILRMEEVFGGIKLRVPMHWAIQNEIDGVFHGVEDKRKQSIPLTSGSEKVLILKGSAIFAGIEITNY